MQARPHHFEIRIGDLDPRVSGASPRFFFCGARLASGGARQPHASSSGPAASKSSPRAEAKRTSFIRGPRQRPQGKPGKQHLAEFATVTYLHSASRALEQPLTGRIQCRSLQRAASETAEMRARPAREHFDESAGTLPQINPQMTARDSFLPCGILLRRTGKVSRWQLSQRCLRDCQAVLTCPTGRSSLSNPPCPLNKHFVCHEYCHYAR